jgi:hypothetical protein
MKIKTISCLRVIILFINIFLFFPLQSTPWIKSPITQKIPMEYYNNTAGKKRTLLLCTGRAASKTRS